MKGNIITYGTAEYSEMVDLRKRILREPLGLVFAKEDLEKDAKDILCGYYNDDNNLIGTCILSKLDSNRVQLRQMAIDPICQGRGIGKLLLEFAERMAIEHNYTDIVLHARKTAINFYEKSGYNSIGEEFTEVGILHIEMVKPLGTDLQNI